MDILTSVVTHIFIKICVKLTVCAINKYYKTGIIILIITSVIYNIISMS